MEYQQNAQYYDKGKELNVIEINNRRLEYLDDLKSTIRYLRKVIIEKLEDDQRFKKSQSTSKYLFTND